MSDLEERLARLTPKQRALLESRLGRKPSPVTGIEPGPSDSDFYPLSFSQQRLWFIDQMNPTESLTYHISHAIRLLGTLRVPALRQALAEVIGRHESLRTTLAEKGGVPSQAVAATWRAELPLVDMAALPGSVREAVAKELVLEVSGRPFSLVHGPLLRSLLLRLGPSDHVLALVSHHIISDAWSTVILVRDLTSFYLALAEGQASSLPTLKVQFRDFAVWQRQLLEGTLLESESAYWRRKLLGASSFVSLPTDRQRSSARNLQASHERFRVDAPSVAALEDLGRRAESTLFMVILAVYATLVRYQAGQQDIVISAPISYRDQPGCENLIGFFANTLLLRVDLSGDPEFLELLGRVRTLVLEAFEHQHLPLDLVIKAAAPERSRDYPPFLQLGLNFIHSGMARVARSDLDSAMEEAPLQVEDFEVGFPNTPNELGLVCYHDGQTLRGILNYRAGIFDRGTVVTFIDQLLYLFGQVVANPLFRLSELDGKLRENASVRRQALHATLDSSLASSFRQRQRKAGRSATTDVRSMTQR
jgi:hypothetical protein